MEIDGQMDRYKKTQPDRLEVNEELIGAWIEKLWEFNELDGNKVNQCFKRTVAEIKKGNKVHIKWEEDNLHEGHPKISQETLAKSRYNKHVAGKKGVSPVWIKKLDEQISV